MRKILISILLAGAAASPAFAYQDSDHHQDNHPPAQNNHQQAHESRAPANAQAREQRGPNQPYYAPRQRDGGAAQRQAEGAYAQQRNAYNQERNAYNQQRGAYEQQRNVYNQQRGAYQQQRGAYEQQRQAYLEGRGQGYRNGGDYRRGYGNRNGLAVSTVPRFGTQPPLRTNSRRVQDLNWNRNWRNNGRYDWRGYREQHRSRFHLGYYVDPFGWGYQAIDIGYRMWPQYYGEQYWLDPQMYDLPYPPPGCAWVRYYNDAVLIDTYSGSVVDVIPAFFW